MTANAFAEDMQKCLDAGMNAYLAKPLEVQKVIAVIAQGCNNSYWNNGMNQLFS